VIAAMTCTDGTVKEPAHDAGGGRLVATVTDPDCNTPSCLTTDECHPLSRAQRRMESR
jgi:hypothetical protein